MDPDAKSWENSLRSNLYDKNKASNPRPIINQTKGNCKPSLPVLSRSENRNNQLTFSPHNWSPRRQPKRSEKTRSSPILNLTFTRCPNMEKETDSSSENTPGKDNLLFDKSYLKMIKKRQSLLYGNSQHQDMSQRGDEEGDVTPGGSTSHNINNSPMARFSRHISETQQHDLDLGDSAKYDNQSSSYEISEPHQSSVKPSTAHCPDNVETRTMSHGLTVGDHQGMAGMPEVDYRPVTLQAIDMQLSSGQIKQRVKPAARAIISETCTPSTGIIIDDNDDEHSNVGVLSYARSYTTTLHHSIGVDEWNAWDTGPVKRISSLHGKHSNKETLHQMLHEVHGLKRKGKVENVRAQMNCCSLLWHDFKLWRRQKKYKIGNNPVFNKQIQIIESQFGSGTVSFFIFVRWLLLLNALLCGIWTITVVIPQAVFYTGYSEMLTNFYFTNIIDGKNALSGSFMFYGGYEATLGPYPLALVYLCCVLITYFGSLFVISKGVAVSLEAGGLLKDTRHSYCNLVLTGWDYSLTNHEAALNMSYGFINTFKDLISEARARAYDDISGKECFKLYLKRSLAWIITVTLIGGGCALIFFVVTTDIAEFFTGMGYEVDNDDILVVYAPSLVFMTINSLVPLTVYKLPLFENYAHGKAELNVSTLRVFVLRMVNILALVLSLHYKQQTQVGCVGTYLGQELYKLVVLDTLVQVITTLVPKFIQFYWTNKKKEFMIPQTILVLVYRQALIWLGTLFCPVMPLVGVISTSIFFAVNYLMVTITCKPPVKRWNQARRNTLFLGLTAVTLIVLIIPISIIITRNDAVNLWVEKSSTATGSSDSVCGPFGNDTMLSAFWITHTLLEDFHPVSAVILKILTSGTILLPLVFIIIAVAYYQSLRITWQKSQMISIYSELIAEREQNIEMMKRNLISSDNQDTYA